MSRHADLSHSVTISDNQILFSSRNILLKHFPSQYAKWWYNAMIVWVWSSGFTSFRLSHQTGPSVASSRRSVFKLMRVYGENTGHSVWRAIICLRYQVQSQAAKLSLESQEAEGPLSYSEILIQANCRVCECNLLLQVGNFRAMLGSFIWCDEILSYFNPVQPLHFIQSVGICHGGGTLIWKVEIKGLETPSWWDILPQPQHPSSWPPPSASPAWCPLISPGILRGFE